MIGVAPPQIAQWDEAHVRGRLTTVDIVEAARAEVGKLRGRVDLIVALCHSGISRFAPALGEENAGQDLARLDGVDALFLGHQHLLFPGEDFADAIEAAALQIYTHKPCVTFRCKIFSHGGWVFESPRAFFPITKFGRNSLIVSLLVHPNTEVKSSIVTDTVRCISCPWLRQHVFIA